VSAAGDHRDRGTVTAEVAVALPVIVLVLAACLGGLGLAAAQLRAQDAAADAARLLGRGESIAAAQQHVIRVAPSSRLTVSRPSGLVCANVHVEQRVMLMPIVLSASSCALDGGR
jgi:Flp pilus assembly protein TadG